MIANERHEGVAGRASSLGVPAVAGLRSSGMDQLEQFLAAVQTSGVSAGRFRGLLYVLIGLRIARPDGTEVSPGMNWRAAAALLKKARWDREAVRELGVDPAELAPRDREKFWYAAINRAGLATPEAKQAAQELAPLLRPLGYVVEVS